MSFRATISVYINGKMADIGYYRNWSAQGLLFEAVATGAIFRDCPSVEAYRQAVFGGQRVDYIIEPESFENTDENLEMLESLSEYPVVVDITAGSVYRSYGSLPPEKVGELPVYDGRISDLNEDDYFKLLDGHRIPFAEDADRIIAMFASSKELRGHLSEKTASFLDNIIET